MDNLFHSTPAKMSDGRHVTDYNKAATREQYIQAQYNVPNSFEYSNLIRASGNDIAKQTFLNIVNSNHLPIDPVSNIVDKSVPTSYADLCTKHDLKLPKCGE